MKRAITRRVFAAGALSASLMPGVASACAPWPTHGWASAPPESQGISASALAALNGFAQSNNSHALLVIKNGFLIHEQYYAGKNADTVFDGYSLAKSVASMVAGGAVARGAIPSVETPISTWYPAISADPLKAQITVEHLLNMQSGIDFSNRNHYAAMIASPDWAEYALSRPMQYQPGTWWRYKTDLNVLAGVIRKATGKDLWWQAQAYAFNAMGNGDPAKIAWRRDARGNANGSGDLRMTAQYWARFGYLYLRNGVWDGQQLIPASWVAQSRAPTADPNRVFCNCWSETGMSASGVTLQHHYGWWSVATTAAWQGVPQDAYYAFGGVGQFVIIIPSLDMVIVRMGDGPFPYPDGYFLRDLLLHVATL